MSRDLDSLENYDIWNDVWIIKEEEDERSS